MGTSWKSIHFNLDPGQPHSGIWMCQELWGYCYWLFVYLYILLFLHSRYVTHKKRCFDTHSRLWRKSINLQFFIEPSIQFQNTSYRVSLFVTYFTCGNLPVEDRSTKLSVKKYQDFLHSLRDKSQVFLQKIK